MIKTFTFDISQETIDFTNFCHFSVEKTFYLLYNENIKIERS